MLRSTDEAPGTNACAILGPVNCGAAFQSEFHVKALVLPLVTCHSQNHEDMQAKGIAVLGQHWPVSSLGRYLTADTAGLRRKTAKASLQLP